jgi:hypothetical protein
LGAESSARTSYQERAEPEAADPERKHDRRPADHDGRRATALDRCHGDADEEDGKEKKQRTEDTTLSHGATLLAEKPTSTIDQPNLGA